MSDQRHDPPPSAPHDYPEGVISPDDWWASIDAAGFRRPNHATAPPWLTIAPTIGPDQSPRGGTSS